MQVASVGVAINVENRLQWLQIAFGSGQERSQPITADCFMKVCRQ